MTPPPRSSIGRALIVSENAMTTRQLTEALQELSLSVEVCVKVSDALQRVKHGKLEVGVIDLSLGDQAHSSLSKCAARPRTELRSCSQSRAAVPRPRLC
jgi:ActR/RegA family two-component response regulator